MTEEKKYLFGPVPSRRLGLSLGIDIVPFKVCTLDCIYCQLGKTTEKTIKRKKYVPIEAVLAELEQRLTEGVKTDYITISGSGEPTLNCLLGELIDGIKKITDIPVAVLTNGTLFYDCEVRADCAKADVVLPSLDAADQQTFEKINRPHPDISIDMLLDGLVKFRDEFAGQIWLEIFIIEGFNADSTQIDKIKQAVERIRPDRIQLNTAVRPTAETAVEKTSLEKLRAIAEKLGPHCEIIADFQLSQGGQILESKAEDVLSLLKRRPCSLEDICAGLGINRNEALKYITIFQKNGLLSSEQSAGTCFFKAN